MRKNEKKFIPGTHPTWNKELPEGYDNSLTDKAGHSWDNGYNFDEKNDDDDETFTAFDELSKVKYDPETAMKAREERTEQRMELHPDQAKDADKPRKIADYN